jgi:hypothetical protein
MYKFYLWQDEQGQGGILLLPSACICPEADSLGMWKLIRSSGGARNACFLEDKYVDDGIIAYFLKSDHLRESVLVGGSS